MNLLAQIRRRRIWIITQRVADCLLRHKDQELIVGHRQPELLVDIIVGLGSLVTSTAGTVEGRACIDTRRRDIAAVLAAEGVASPAFGGRWVREGQGGCRQNCED